MKKYLITAEQVSILLSIAECDAAWKAKDILESLKPIEPLDDDDIDRMWYEATAGRMHRKLARAIERHILGETL